MRDQDGSSLYRATLEMQTVEAGRGTLSSTSVLALEGGLPLLIVRPPEEYEWRGQYVYSDLL